jgi:hypothetical protein
VSLIFLIFVFADYVQRMAFHAQLLECYAKRHGYIMIPNVVHPNCAGPEWEEYSICWSRMCSMSKEFFCARGLMRSNT